MSCVIYCNFRQTCSLWLTSSGQLRYDMRCYFNVRSKAGMNQLNIPHGNDSYKKCKTEKLKSKNGYAQK